MRLTPEVSSSPLPSATRLIISSSRNIPLLVNINSLSKHTKLAQHLNPLKERELDLRGGSVRWRVRDPISLAGLQIPLIENLASHQGSYDTLNLTDNSLTTLGNIPLCAL